MYEIVGKLRIWRYLPKYKLRFPPPRRPRYLPVNMHEKVEVMAENLCDQIPIRNLLQICSKFRIGRFVVIMLLFHPVTEWLDIGRHTRCPFSLLPNPMTMIIFAGIQKLNPIA